MFQEEWNSVFGTENPKPVLKASELSNFGDRYMEMPLIIAP